jgi:hypothetical protein
MKIQISIPEPRTRSAQTSVTETQYRELRRLAAEHGTTVSGLLHAIIEAHLSSTEGAQTAA